jgi:hypothetical protein
MILGATSIAIRLSRNELYMTAHPNRLSRL